MKQLDVLKRLESIFVSIKFITAQNKRCQPLLKVSESLLESGMIKSFISDLMLLLLILISNYCEGAFIKKNAKTRDLFMHRKARINSFELKAGSH